MRMLLLSFSRTVGAVLRSVLRHLLQQVVACLDAGVQSVTQQLQRPQRSKGRWLLLVGPQASSASC